MSFIEGKSMNMREKKGVGDFHQRKSGDSPSTNLKKDEDKGWVTALLTLGRDDDLHNVR